jgi:hypothetical protein
MGRIPNYEPHLSKPATTLVLLSGMLFSALFGMALFVMALCGCAGIHRYNEASHSIKTYHGRSDGLIGVEEWRDDHKVGARFFFADPTSQGLCDRYTNQPAIGGSGWFMGAPFSMVVDSNLVPAISATGTAAGNIIGATVKTIAK